MHVNQEERERREEAKQALREMRGLDPLVTQPGATCAYDPKKPAHQWAQEVVKLQMENAELRKERAKLQMENAAVKSDIEDMRQSKSKLSAALYEIRCERDRLQSLPADNRAARSEDLVPTFHKTYAVMWGQLRRIVGRSSNDRDRALIQLMNDLEGAPEPKTGRPEKWGVFSVNEDGSVHHPPVFTTEDKWKASMWVMNHPQSHKSWLIDTFGDAE